MRQRLPIPKPSRKQPTTALQNAVHSGDLWQVGKHRLLCGDSTDTAQVLFAMQGERAQLTITSPPYNLGHSASLNRMSYGGSRYRSDSDARSLTDYLHLLIEATKNALLVSKVVIVNIQLLSGNKIAVLEYLHHFRHQLIDIVIWDKGNAPPAMTRNVLNSQFELLLFFTSHQSKGKTPRTIPTADFRGTVANVYKAPPQRGNSYYKVHAATFPLHLPLWLLQTFDAAAGNVLEPFCGTGTTLLATERLHRAAIGIEIDPLYCALTLERLEAETGQKPRLTQRYTSTGSVKANRLPETVDKVHMNYSPLLEDDKVSSD